MWNLVSERSIPDAIANVSAFRLFLCVTMVYCHGVRWCLWTLEMKWICDQCIRFDARVNRLWFYLMLTILGRIHSRFDILDIKFSWISFECILHSDSPLMVWLWSRTSPLQNTVRFCLSSIQKLQLINHSSILTKNDRWNFHDQISRMSWDSERKLVILLYWDLFHAIFGLNKSRISWPDSAEI